MIKLQSLKNVRKAHNNNALKTLEHRLEVAKAKGQTALISQLEAERNYYLK